MRNLIKLSLLISVVLATTKLQQPITEKLRSQMTYIDSSIEDVVWCMNGKKQIIYLLSQSGKVFRSNNNGFEWDDLTDLFKRIAYTEIVQTEKVGKVDKIIKSNEKDSIVIFLGTNNMNWITEDCGKSYDVFSAGKQILEVQVHPISSQLFNCILFKEKKWMLGSAWISCNDDITPCYIYKQLLFSDNGGRKWKVLHNYIVLYYYFQIRALDQQYNLTKVPQKRILITTQSNQEGHQKYSGWSKGIDMMQSDDFFRSSHVIVKGGNKFLVAKSFIMCAKVENEKEEIIKLYIAKSNALDYEFNEAQIPLKHFKQQSYTLLDNSHEQIYLHINHQDYRQKYGNIFISDATGTRFSLSQLHNIRSIDGQCDFEKVESMEGIYLTNSYEADFIDMIKGDKQTDWSGIIDNHKQTKITFDNGKTWQKLVPPKYDSDSKPISCREGDQDCSLHLHSISN